MLTERGPPKDYDIPSTIVIYILVIMLGVGMCFCLRRANRLLPNQRSFQLRPTSSTQRRGYDIADEEQGDPESRTGLLSAGYDDEEEEEEDEHNRFMNRREDRRRVDDYDPDELEDCEEEFGDMQGASSPSSPMNDSNNNDKPRTPLFGIVDDDDDDDEEEEDNSDNEQRESQQKKKDKTK